VANVLMTLFVLSWLVELFRPAFVYCAFEELCEEGAFQEFWTLEVCFFCSRPTSHAKIGVANLGLKCV